MLDQNLIDRIVSAKLEDWLSSDTLDTFVVNTSVYDEDFQAAEIGVFNWITDGHAFDKGDLRYWDDYFDEDWLLKIGFADIQLRHWLEKHEPTVDEYKLFLRAWIPYSFENFDWSSFPIASIHRLQHTDGRHCIALVAMTEGGQGGWEFGDVFIDLFKRQDEALGYLNHKGIIEGYTEHELTAYIDRVAG